MIITPQMIVDSYWEMPRWRSLSWLRNVVLRVTGRPKEERPIVYTYPQANAAVFKIVNSLTWGLAWPVGLLFGPIKIKTSEQVPQNDLTQKGAAQITAPSQAEKSQTNPSSPKLISLPSLPRVQVEGGLKIHWVIPGLVIGSGGHRVILRTAHYLERFGHKITLHFANVSEPPEKLRDILQKHFYPTEAEIKHYDGQFMPCDVVFATHWTTVKLALAAGSAARGIFYFVQDFEPAFTAMGSDYILAENTYRQGLYCVASGPWCEHFLRRDYGLDADHYRFAMNKDLYFPRPRTKKNRNIVFFARPDMPRRCYPLGVEVLAEVHRLKPDVEIIFFGSEWINEKEIPYSITCHKVLSVAQLGEMYSNADLGIVFSTTNPSMAPYEMMAAGLPVVDIKRPDSETNYGGRSDIAFLAAPEPEKMAQQIVDLLDNSAELAKRRTNGLEFTASFPTEEQMARKVEELIYNRLDKTRVS